MQTNNTDPQAQKQAVNPRRQQSGLAFLSQGFRPFFLGASAWAFIAMSIWIASWLGLPMGFLIIDSNWHIHEMLFGFTAAAIAGFILTAIPNWTKRLPVRGRPLAILFAIWIAGRIAMLMQPILGMKALAIIDSLFLVCLLAVILREIIHGKNWRNLIIALLIAAIAMANIWFHLENLGIVTNDGTAMRAAISLITLLITIIGGRIVPSFTRNALKRRASTALPAIVGNFDRLTLLTTLATGVAFTLSPNSLFTAVLAIFCAAMNFIRLIRWQGLKVLFEPMLWILHLAYLWIGIGFALLAASFFLPQIPQSAAIHAFTTGAFSSMILAVMSRASFGHTGRALKANLPTLLIYCSITLAAIFRIAGSIFAASIYYNMASVFWLLAFGLFVIAYWPVLTGPDVRTINK